MDNRPVGRWTCLLLYSLESNDTRSNRFSPNPPMDGARIAEGGVKK